MDDWTIESRVTNPPLQLSTAEKAFRPNPVTVRFARAVEVHPGDVVFDIGTGIGPLAIKAALDGASHVFAVDPVELHCELAEKNVERYGLVDRVHILHGEFFAPFDTDPVLRATKADVIIGDVSGIAEVVAHALGWYSDAVPTGGPDGADVLVELLRRAGRFLKPGGRLYFPVAVDLSIGQRIMDVAKTCYRTIINALPRPYIQFPLSAQEVRALREAYHGAVPSFINIQGGDRPHWRGQIWKAANPILP